MRVEFHAAAEIDRSPALRSYAETRVWLAVGRAARGAGGGRRPTWVGVTVTRRDGGAGRPEVACQVDAWLRGVGLVTVRHAGEDTRDAIECASVRLGREIRRKPANLARPVWPRKDGGGAWLAERTWEDDGGRNVAGIDPSPALPGRYAVKCESTRHDRTTARRRRDADRHRTLALAHAGD